MDIPQTAVERLGLFWLLSSISLKNFGEIVEKFGEIFEKFGEIFEKFREILDLTTELTGAPEAPHEALKGWPFFFREQLVKHPPPFGSLHWPVDSLV